MTDYTKLVKSLRCCATMTCKGDECKYMILGCHDCFPKLHNDAAAAIEELQKTLGAVQKNSGINYRMWKEAQAEVERLKSQDPKRVNVVRCKDCVHFAQNGWCNREFDWFPVTGDDFCSMAEKM